MKVKDLKLALEQYDDESLVTIQIPAPTVNKLHVNGIKSISVHGDVYEVKNAEKSPLTSALILEIE